MKRYYDDIAKTIDRLTPWEKNERYERRKRQLQRMGVKPGQLVVIGGAGNDELSSKLFEGAKIL